MPFWGARARREAACAGRLRTRLAAGVRQLTSAASRAGLHWQDNVHCMRWMKEVIVRRARAENVWVRSPENQDACLRRRRGRITCK